MHINFVSSNDTGEIRTIFVWSDNKEIWLGNETDERLCESNDYCSAEMPTKFNNFLKYNHGEKSSIASFIIYVDLECLLLKQQSCQNNPSKSYTK